MRMTLFNGTAALVLVAATASAQSHSQQTCSLSAFRNRERVTIRGMVGRAPHDMPLLLPSCKEAVMLVYAGDPESGESGEKLVRNSSLKRFEKYTSATYGRVGEKGLCLECPRYEVEATLTGRLDIASDEIPAGLWKDKLGVLHDQSGKSVGVVSFGHPPTHKYRLVIESVSHVVARKLVKPKKSNDSQREKVPGKVVLPMTAYDRC